MHEAKMRSRLIRLAYARPEHRERLLPLLRSGASTPRSQVSQAVMKVRSILGEMVKDMSVHIEEAEANSKETGGTVFYTTRGEVCNAGRQLADEIRAAGVPKFKGVRQSVGTYSSPSDWGLPRTGRASSKNLWRRLQRHLLNVQVVLQKTAVEMLPLVEDMPLEERVRWARFVEDTFCDMGMAAGRQFDQLVS